MRKEDKKRNIIFALQSDVNTMIQRIQTVYMLLAILALAGLYIWFPVINHPDGGLLVDKQELLILIPLVLSAVIVLASIFQYKKRQMQPDCIQHFMTITLVDMSFYV